ncbi:hypothetical protein ACP4OV_004900 [Aristida adscensionis]
MTAVENEIFGSISQQGTQVEARCFANPLIQQFKSIFLLFLQGVQGDIVASLPLKPFVPTSARMNTKSGEMSGKGKRRSARLMKLEEQKNDGDGPVCLLDPWQIIRNSISGSSARGKRKRNEEIQQLQGEASSGQQVDAAAAHGHLSGQSSIGQIIDYILDELELRDKHELFAMPDDIQVTDYTERVDRPGDFATLRQNNKDGMYKELVHFENDVYMVFQKAMSMNSQDTVPFREAMSLLDQAKQVFLSLKHNQMYTESEITAWRHSHLYQPQEAITPGRIQGDGGGDPSRYATAAAGAATPPLQRPTGTTPRKNARRSGGGGGVPENQRAPARQRGGKETVGTPPAKKSRKAAPVEVASAAVAGRRLTYAREAGAGQGRRETAMPMMAMDQGGHATLINPVQEHTYRDSLQRFVRHAGLTARVAAEFRTLECVARARHSPAPHYWSGGGFLPAPPAPPRSPSPQALPPSADQAPAPATECKLETDELLKLFVVMDKPAVFLERAKKMFGDDKGGESATEVRASKASAAASADADATPAEPARKSGKAQLGHGAGASGEAAAAFGPFSPPKLVVPGRLGFGQFAGSSAQPFKVKPSTPNASGKKKIP